MMNLGLNIIFSLTLYFERTYSGTIGHLLESDSFARFVELSGNDGGDEFGFYFEDNYFDLMPGVRKKIRISGRHEGGIITAKAHYSPHVTQINRK